MASGERDLTRGSVWRQVLAYAMPLVASSLLQALYSMVDTVIAGHFAGSAAISAINNSGQILNILTKIAIGITTGGNIIIGQYYGAKEQGRLGEASGTLLSLSLLLGAATAVGLYAGAYPLLGLLGAPAMEQSVAYLRICAVGMVFVFGYNALSAVLEELYEDADFCAFASLYGRARSDASAAAAVLGLYDFSRTLPHPAAALQSICAAYEMTNIALNTD